MGRAALLAVPLLAAALGAGCLGDAGPSLLGGDGEDVRTRWDVDLSSCGAVSVTVPVDKDQVDRFLPLGFKAQDAGGTFGYEGESGRTNLTLHVVDCGEGEVGGGGADVPALAVPSVRLQPPGVLDGSVDAAYYAWTVHAEDPQVRGVLEEMGHEDNRSKVVADLETTPLGSGGTATVAGDETLYEARSGAGEPSRAIPGDVRFYHEGERGLLVLEAAWEGPAVDGSAELQANEGSRVERFMDTPREPAYGVVRGGAGLAGAWHLVGGEAGSGR